MIRGNFLKKVPPMTPSKIFKEKFFGGLIFLLPTPLVRTDTNIMRVISEKATLRSAAFVPNAKKEQTFKNKPLHKPF